MNNNQQQRRKKKTGCLCFWQKKKKQPRTQEQNTNQNNRNNSPPRQANEQQNNNQQHNNIENSEQLANVKEVVKPITITTNIEVDQIKSMDDKPVGIDSQIYPYCCPICLRYYNHILKLSCCSNYVCLFCLNAIEDQITTKKIERQCWWCRNEEFEIEDVNQQDGVKAYSDANQLQVTNKEFTSIVKQSKNFTQTMQLQAQNDARSICDFMQTIKSANFPARSIMTRNNINGPEPHEHQNEKENSLPVRDDFSELEEIKDNQSDTNNKFSKTDNNMNINRLASEQQHSKMKQSNLYFVDQESGQYVNNREFKNKNMGQSHQNPVIQNGPNFSQTCNLEQLQINKSRFKELQEQSARGEGEHELTIDQNDNNSINHSNNQINNNNNLNFETFQQQLQNTEIKREDIENNNQEQEKISEQEFQEQEKQDINIQQQDNQQGEQQEQEEQQEQQ